MTIREKEVCEVTIIHPEALNVAKKKAVAEEDIERAAEFFKYFGDPTRLKILTALSSTEMCGCDLAALLDITQSAISHQLRKLKQGRLVKSRRDGKVVYYSLDDDHIEKILKDGLDHIKETGK